MMKMDEMSNEMMDMICCIIAILLYYTMDSVSPLLSSLISIRLLRSKTDGQLEMLNEQLINERREMNALSPTGQYAAYIKKKRIVDKLQSEHVILASACGTERFKLKFAVSWITFMTLQTLMGFCLYRSTNLMVMHIPSTYFYPFNIVLRFPSLTDQSTDANQVSVSLFFLLWSGIFVLRRILKRTISTLTDTGLRFNAAGQLEHIETGESFNIEEYFSKQQGNENGEVIDQIVAWEELNSLVHDEVMRRLIKEKMERFTIKSDEKNDDDEEGEEEKINLSTYIFISLDAGEKKNLIGAGENKSEALIVLIGAGLPGFWRSDEISIQLPYVRRCHEKNWIVVLIGNDDRGGSKKKKKTIEDDDDDQDDPLGQSTMISNQQLAILAWKEAMKYPSNSVAVIAHSNGGILLEYILRNNPEPRLKAICLSDCVLSYEKKSSWWQSAVRIGRLWVPSGRPLGAGEKTRAGIRCVSAGTRDPSSIPAMVIDAQLDFIGSAFVDSNGQSSN